MVAILKTTFSQIRASSADFAAPDYLIGVQGNTADVRYSFSQMCNWRKISIPQQFGAVADGITDDASALNAFFSSLGVGNIGFIPAGDYAVGSTVKWGNGSNTQRSTVRGCTVIFEGASNTDASLGTPVPPQSGVRFKWIGAAGGTVFEVAGPVSGLRGIGELNILCQNSAARGIAYISVENSEFDSFGTYDWTSIGIEFNVRPVTTIDGAVQELSTGTNFIHTIASFNYSAIGGTAILLDGYKAIGGFNVTQLHIIKASCGISLNGGTGIHYGFTDFTTIDTVIIISSGVLLNNPAGVRYVGAALPFPNVMPQNNTIRKIALTNGLGVVTDDSASGIGPNFIDYYSMGDGAAWPNMGGTLANLSYVGINVVGTSAPTAPSGFPAKIGYGLSCLHRVDSPGIGGYFEGYSSTDNYVTNVTFLYSLGRSNANGALVSAFGDVQFETGAAGGPTTGVFSGGAADGAMKLPPYSKTALPGVSAARMIYVTDEVGGAVPAFSDGANWRRVTDRAIVS